jgi:hypothetical protein
MAFFTLNQFEAIAQTGSFKYKSRDTILMESRNQTKTIDTISVFLSHSHTDKDLIDDAVAFLKKLNVNIYVDWLDETMPEKTSGETAQKIKNKIILSDKFLLLATNKAVGSKWCNWELGIGDTFKFSKDCLAILPLADNIGHWTGNEYLQIYPRIEPVLNFDTIFKIIYPDGTYKWLHEWIKK